MSDEQPGAREGERPGGFEGAVPTGRVPVFRISLTNATVLSALYLLVASVVELARRFFNFHWADRASKMLEEFPARVLHLVRLFEPLRDAYLTNKVSELQVRLIYGLVVVLIVFGMGMAVGGLLWLLARNARVPVDPEDG